MLDLARQEMLALSHWWIGTEHVLWGLASEESLTSLLTPLLITPERIHAGMVFIFDPEKHQGPSGSSSPPLADISTDVLELLTPRATQVIFLAAEEMKSQGEQRLRPTHLLLGLLHEGAGSARACCARWASVLYRRAPRSFLLLPISAAPSAGATIPRSPASSRQRSAPLQAAHPRQAPSSVITV